MKNLSGLNKLNIDPSLDVVSQTAFEVGASYIVSNILKSGQRNPDGSISISWDFIVAFCREHCTDPNTLQRIDPDFGTHQENLYSIPVFYMGLEVFRSNLSYYLDPNKDFDAAFDGLLPKFKITT